MVNSTLPNKFNFEDLEKSLQNMMDDCCKKDIHEDVHKFFFMVSQVMLKILKNDKIIVLSVAETKEPDKIKHRVAIGGCCFCPSQLIPILENCLNDLKLKEKNQDIDEIGKLEISYEYKRLYRTAKLY